MTIQAEVFAKPGELLQGILPGNRPFLLSNKSSRTFRTVTTILSEPYGTPQFTGDKAHDAAQFFMQTASLPAGTIPFNELPLKMESNIPAGKGLSSSSADILSVLYALNAFYNTKLTREALYAIAARIEPTDPCLHDEQLLFNPQLGQISLNSGVQPFDILYFDSEPETVVNTVDCAAKRHTSSALQQQYASLYAQATQALKTGNWSLLTTQLKASALLNDAFLPKKKLAELICFAEAHQFGVFVAHTGTYMGLLLPSQTPANLRATANAYLQHHWNTNVYAE